MARKIKPNRQFSARGEERESSVEDMLALGATPEEIAEILAAVEEAEQGRAAWEAAGRPGLDAIKARVQRWTDLQFAGMQGYPRNEELGIFTRRLDQSGRP